MCETWFCRDSNFPVISDDFSFHGAHVYQPDTYSCKWIFSALHLISSKWVAQWKREIENVSWVWLFSVYLLEIHPCLRLISNGIYNSRYSPMMFPSIMTFPSNGVHLKPDQPYVCNKKICSVVLDNLNRKSTGSYRCEISGDAPEFHVVHETANMTAAGECWPTDLGRQRGCVCVWFYGILVERICRKEETDYILILQFNLVCVPHAFLPELFRPFKPKSSSQDSL